MQRLTKKVFLCFRGATRARPRGIASLFITVCAEPVSSAARLASSSSSRCVQMTDSRLNCPYVPLRLRLERKVVSHVVVKTDYFVKRRHLLLFPRSQLRIGMNRIYASHGCAVCERRLLVQFFWRLRGWPVVVDGTTFLQQFT